MKNAIIICLIVILTAFLIVVRVQYKNRLEVFNYQLKEYSLSKVPEIIAKRESQLQELQKSNLRLATLFSKQYNIDSAYLIKDTLFKYLYLKKYISYRYLSPQYIICLIEKCKSEILDQDNNLKIKRRNEILASRYGDDYNFFYSQLKDKKLLKKESVLIECTHFFKSVYVTVWDEKIWTSFEDLLKQYRKDKIKVISNNLNARNRYNNLYAATISNLNSEGKKYFNQKLDLDKSQIINSINLDYSFKSEALGEINYSFESISLNISKYNDIEADAIIEQYRNNSLETGAMPYYYCYGSSNSCDYWSCSEIVIENGGQDALVLVKDASGNVVRHAYIKEDNRFTFKVVDGSYIVYFYSGHGWNPNKIIDGKNCKLRGGFVSNESFSKGTYEYLQSQQLTYVLRLRQNGNFSPRSTSMDEAFN